MAKFIVFQDGDMLGYLNDESTARRAISDLADKLSEDLRIDPSSKETRVFRENIERGVNIYTQVIGSYINGAVILKHTIEWKSLPEFKP